jgi:hypothetical protein
MKFLITGGAGIRWFSPRRPADRAGAPVSVIDDLSTGSIRNLSHLRQHPDFSYVIADVMDETLLAELVDDADAVFHLAAAVGVQLIVEIPVRTIETNIRCTELVLKGRQEGEEGARGPSRAEREKLRNLQPYISGGQAGRMWTSFAPQSKSRWMVSFSCVPRTMESSQNSSRLPAISSRIGISFIRPPGRARAGPAA